jgi:hypothetical protein
MFMGGLMTLVPFIAFITRQNAPSAALTGCISLMGIALVALGIWNFKRFARARRPVYEFEEGFIATGEGPEPTRVMVMRWDDIQSVKKYSGRYGTSYTISDNAGSSQSVLSRTLWLRCKARLQEYDASHMRQKMK